MSILLYFLLKSLKSLSRLVNPGLVMGNASVDTGSVPAEETCVSKHQAVQVYNAKKKTNILNPKSLI